MNKSKKTALGLLSLWPLAYSGVAAVVFLPLVFPGKAPAMPHREISSTLFAVFFVLHGITLLLLFGLAGFYLNHLYHDPRRSTGFRIGWTAALLVFSIPANPVYWYLYIWREPETPGYTFESH